MKATTKGNRGGASPCCPPLNDSAGPAESAEAEYIAAHDALLDALLATGQFDKLEELFTDLIYTAQKAAYYAGFETAREI